MKKLAIAILLLIASCFYALTAIAASVTLMSGQSVTGASGYVTLPTGSGLRSFQVILHNTGAATASVDLQGSTDSINWTTLTEGTPVIFTAPGVQGGTNQAAWPYERCYVNYITGTGSTIDCKRGY